MLTTSNWRTPWCNTNILLQISYLMHERQVFVKRYKIDATNMLCHTKNYKNTIMDRLPQLERYVIEQLWYIFRFLRNLV